VSVLRPLLHQIVDYAGLFPPAGLDLETVSANYHNYRDGEANWMLARVIVPASRLDEFKQTASQYWTSEAEPWKVSALVPALDSENSFQSGLEKIAAFNQQNLNCVVDAIEVKCPRVQDVAPIAGQVPATVRAFLEVPHASDPLDFLQAIAEVKAAANATNLFAKIRTGGMQEDLIPPIVEVARFIKRCVETKVGFKATAGLHHPLRNEFDLTYKPDSPRGTMHGFLNVFIAAMFAYSGSDLGTIEAILNIRDVGDLEFSDRQIKFAGHTVDVEQVEKVRKNYAISFGSCSFEEPVTDLGQLGFQTIVKQV